MKLLDSPDKIQWPKAAKTLGLIFIFFTGWIGKDVYRAHNEHPRYVAKIVTALNRYDEKQFHRSYSQAYKSGRPRNRNHSFRLIHSLFYEAERDKCNVSKVIRDAVMSDASPVPELIQERTVVHLIESHARAKELGLYLFDPTDEDLFLGKAPEITRGPNKGELAHVDHIIPAAVVPQLGLTLINLRWMAQNDNSSRQANPTDESVKLLCELVEIGFLDKDIIRRNFVEMESDKSLALIAKKWLSSDMKSCNSL